MAVMTNHQLVLSLFPGIDLLGRAFSAQGFCVVKGPDVLWSERIEEFHGPPGRLKALARAVPLASPPTPQDCKCGCGRPVTPPRLFAEVSCRQRSSRANHRPRRVIAYYPDQVMPP